MKWQGYFQNFADEKFDLSQTEIKNFLGYLDWYTLSHICSVKTLLFYFPFIIYTVKIVPTKVAVTKMLHWPI